MIPTTPPWPAYVALVRRFGLAFRPGLSASSYAAAPFAYVDDLGRAYHDETIKTSLASATEVIDPYTVALEVWQSDGLLGATDLGPASFQVERRQYEERRSRADATTRPRLNLQDLLDAVGDLQQNTHPTRLNLRQFGSWEACEKEFNRHQTRLVDWLNDHGIDVDR